MKADTLTIKKIFGKDIRYLVPLFQRPYVWNKDEHWEPLWLDVTGVAERLLKEMEVAGPGEAADAEEAPRRTSWEQLSSTKSRTRSRRSRRGT